MRGYQRLVARRPAIAVLRERWLALPGNVRGALWVLVSCVFLTTMTAIVKALGTRLEAAAPGRPRTSDAWSCAARRVTVVADSWTGTTPCFETISWPASAS